MKHSCLALLLLAGWSLSVTSGEGQDASHPYATKLLKEARAARAVWENFPGFRADLTVNHNGGEMKGTVTADSSGKIVLQGFPDADVKTWVRRQLASVVGHRLPSPSTKDTPCIFISMNAAHPLGIQIRPLDDEHSSFRIRDRQILEVNRQMKDGERFTITILKNNLTPEKTYLPASYVVNTWKEKTLVSSEAYHHTWKRVGPYNLPETVMVIIAREQTGSTAPPAPVVWLLTLSRHELLAAK